MKDKKTLIILASIAAIAILFGIYSYFRARYSVMTAEGIEWCDPDCQKDDFCNHKRQICSNRTNPEIKCSYIGDNKCYKKCKSDEDCGDRKCITVQNCPIDVCDIDAEELGLGSFHEVEYVQICK